MTPFTFFKVSDGSALNSFDIETFETMAEARRHAATMLAKSDYQAIEIWNGEETAQVTQADLSRSL